MLSGVLNCDRDFHPDLQRCHDSISYSFVQFPSRGKARHVENEVPIVHKICCVLTFPAIKSSMLMVLNVEIIYIYYEKKIYMSYTEKNIFVI